MMRVLLSNDDGYLAPGLNCLAEELSSLIAITVVAPDRNRSGASNSLTLDKPIRATRAENGFFCVDGTPTDCVHLALMALMDERPDIVVSGINAGHNLGDAVLYSGTVAAAMEGRSLGLPAIAVSAAAREPAHYGTAARVTRRILEHMTRGGLAMALPANVILNVNVPDVPYEDLRGFEVTHVGHEHQAQGAIADTDPWGRDIYWVMAPRWEGLDAGPGTDFFAVRQNKVSITPLRVDLTSRSTLTSLSAWIAGL
uniref:5'-nucleotidase SurE n=1 Tax=Candidatus Kentrum sp. TC TaxID=2126339 RepID=A0A450Z0R8_9GAMM|nr:MAG: 5'-nucleotidase [Candidatus Kentron sp. TC]VFK47393.1 MAG: 5'-nucleotidase /3'-nucleotidase /exopolyphosphatase [Candidatus Kentron sp. TC]VFK59630.1 MAG: 5'-nucleotidase [Candidatus Kentron sp. TC]